MNINCPCRELDELRQHKKHAKKQMADMEKALIMLARQREINGYVVRTLWDENKKLKAKLAEANIEGV